MERKHIFLPLLILGTAFWGISYPVTKLAIGAYSPSAFLFYRFLLATLVMSVIFWKHVKAITFLSIKTGAGLAIPMMLGISTQTVGLTHTAASQCAFVAGMCVVIIPLLKMLVYKLATSSKVWVAATIALTGLFVICIKDQLTISIGDLYTITGSFFFAIYLIQVEKQSAKRSLVPTIVPMFATCAILSLCLALADKQTTWLPERDSFWIGIVFCAFFSTAYMYTISNISQRYFTAERVAIIYLFEPVFGAIAAYFILGESFSDRLILGGGLIFLATVISETNIKWPFAFGNLGKIFQQK